MPATMRQLSVLWLIAVHGKQGTHRECLYIENCQRRYCTSAWDTKCHECVDNNIFFKKTEFDRKCERMCAWNGHYCWPGKCDDELKRGCRCADNFTMIDTHSETSCQPTLKPSILTCDTVVLIPGGKMRRAKSRGNSTACSYLEDMYGNFKPTVLQFNMMSEYTIDLKNLSRPNFIEESNFGVTDTVVNLLREEINGVTKSLSVNKVLTDTSSSTQVKQIINNAGNISLQGSAYDLLDGQALCFTFEVHAGGYLKSRNIVTGSISSAIPYHKVSTTRNLCYRFDKEPPQHCQNNGSCNAEPLQLQRRISRSPLQTVAFSGWIDPVPSGGNTYHASSIESYQIIVNEVTPFHGRPSKVDTKVVFSKKVDHTENSMILNLKSDTPRLFSITLEVKDVADNVRQARRFMLFDNTSYIITRTDNPFRVISASSQTNYTWQTHHNGICLDWNGHFLNRFYFENVLLNPIEPDPHGLIAGVYEQLSGDLPVTGTPNVECIIKFMLSFKLDDGIFSNEILVSDLLNQSYCEKLSVTDGQTYIFKLRSEDIANNTFEEEISVSVDHTVPIIKNISLTKEGKNTFFVRHRTDLSTYQFTFETIDIHSGIKTIQWSVSETESGQEITFGVLAVGTLSTKSCPKRTDPCYCPEVGACEFFSYSVPLDILAIVIKRAGDYNTSYYFTVNVTNNAMLSSEAKEEFIINNSAPEIYEYRVAVPILVGGTIGGLIIVIAIALTTFFIIRRKRIPKQSQQRRSNSLETSVNKTTSTNIWTHLDTCRPHRVLQNVIDQRSRNAKNPSECPENQNEYEVFEHLRLNRFETKNGKKKPKVPPERKNSIEATYSTIKKEMSAQDYHLYDDLQTGGRRDDPDYVNLNIFNVSRR